MAAIHEDSIRSQPVDHGFTADTDETSVEEIFACIGRAAILPTHEIAAESFGFAVLEAMSLGRPVVAAATGGLREVIEDERNGLLVPPKDSGSLAEAMIRVLRDPGLTARLGAAGKERAAVFSFERMMSGYESVYSSCLQQVGRAR